jgi:hypothetical protein
MRSEGAYIFERGRNVLERSFVLRRRVVACCVDGRRGRILRFFGRRLDRVGLRRVDRRP